MNKITTPSVTPSFPFSPPLIWQGAFWKVISMACFAGINGIVRYLSGGVADTGIDPLPVNVIIFFQNLIGTLFLFPWILKSGFNNLKTKYPGLHFIRVTTAVAGIYLWYLTLKTMPIAEGVALSFTGPIFTVVGAWIFLHEKMNLQRILAIFLSLLGAFIISRPDIPLRGGEHAIGYYALLPLASAIILSGNKLLTRKLANLGETSTSLATYLLLLMVPVSLLPAVFEWVTPNLAHCSWLMLLGILAAMAHLSFGRAYQLAEVTFLTPFGFTKFLLSTLVGFAAFSELPNNWSLWIGIIIISISIILLAYKIPLYSWANRFKSN